MNDYTLINKNFVENSIAAISIEERGFKFGDGIFETCKIHNGKIHNFKAHKNRFELGIKTLQIAFDASNLEEILEKLIVKNQVDNGILRFSLSRGIGSMGYLPKDGIASTFIAKTYKNHEAKGEIKLGISKIKLAKPNEFLKKCKLNSAIEYVLAKIEARKKGNFDDMMLDENGFICETSSSNLFFIKDGKIFTPSSDLSLLCGTIRDLICRNFEVEEIKIKPSEIANFDEVFITNSNLLAKNVTEIRVFDEIFKFGGEGFFKIEKFLLDSLEN